MIRRILPLAVALLGATSVLATTCSLSQKCPKEAPCCGQYGECGVGAFCLGGCDPRMSFSLDACVPAPVCKDKTFKMDSKAQMDRIVDIGKYLGDPSTADFVSSGEPVLYNNNILLTMAAHSSGTVLATTEYVWYGTVKARLKTGRGAGVVTAFILLSDVKDEIDYEFVGADLGVAQTNYYFQGITDYHNSGNITLSNTYENFHDYEIRWTPDSIIWLVDNQVGRIKNRSETWNATSNQWGFPQTPARLQISIWPAGDEKNAKGTIDWAGGPIDWSSEDIKNYGYDFATFGEISVQCYNAPSAPGTNKGTSYTFNNIAATNDTVVDGDKPTVLKSFAGSGLDMNAGGSSSSSGTATGSSAPVASVPGGSSGGVGTVPGSDSGSGSTDGSTTGSASNCASTGFSQSCGGTGTSSNKNDGVRGVKRTLGASALAVVIGFAGLLFL